MKTSELKRLLKAGGCRLLRHGSRHDIWTNPETGAIAPVPRHDAQEVNPKTLKSIMETLLS